MALSNADKNALEGRALLTNMTPLARQAASMQGSFKSDRTNNAPWGRNSHTALRGMRPLGIWQIQIDQDQSPGDG